MKAESVKSSAISQAAAGTLRVLGDGLKKIGEKAAFRWTEAREEFRFHWQADESSRALTPQRVDREAFLCGFFLAAEGEKPIALYEGSNRFNTVKKGGIKPAFGRYAEMEAEYEIRAAGGTVVLCGPQVKERVLHANECVELGGAKLVLKLLPLSHRRQTTISYEEIPNA